MKYTIIIGVMFSLLFASCETQPSTFDLSSLPSTWVALTELDDELLIFNSCEFGNSIVSIVEEENEWNVVFSGEQEDVSFTVVSAYDEDETIYLECANPNVFGSLKFNWDSERNRMAFWTMVSPDKEVRRLYVDISNSSGFTVFNQPCIECWGEECYWMELDELMDEVRVVFDDYVEYQESVDSDENKATMISNFSKMKEVKDSNHLELLINVWMYYDPTDFEGINMVFDILKKNQPQSIKAIDDRIANKKSWESEESAPYSDLVELKLRILE